jgi:hypothetical protein
VQPTGFGGGSQTGLGGSGMATLDMNCGVVENPVTRLPPDILLVLDKSGSMNASADGTCMENCGAASKWSQTTTALNEVIPATDATVNWGMKLFATSGTCTVSNQVEIPVTEMNAGAVVNRINMTNTGGSTPTRLAIQAAANYLDGLTRPNPKFILLATDGLPNCAPGQPNQDPDVMGAVTAVTNALSAGVPTFVIGIALTTDPTADQTLSMMATAGGYPRQGTPTYYPVSNTADLVAALNAIVTIAGSCTYPIPAPPNNMTSRSQIDVFVNGTTIPMSTTDGWSYGNTEMTSVVINGPLCQQIMDGNVTDVKVVFRCIVP